MIVHMGAGRVEAAVRGAKNRGPQAVYIWQNCSAYVAAKEIAVSANANGLPCISSFRPKFRGLVATWDR
jgi:hypothetical protein